MSAFQLLIWIPGCVLNGPDSVSTFFTVRFWWKVLELWAELVNWTERRVFDRAKPWFYLNELEIPLEWSCIINSFQSVTVEKQPRLVINQTAWNVNRFLLQTDKFHVEEAVFDVSIFSSRLLSEASHSRWDAMFTCRFLKVRWDKLMRLVQLATPPWRCWFLENSPKCLTPWMSPCSSSWGPHPTF